MSGLPEHEQSAKICEQDLSSIPTDVITAHMVYAFEGQGVFQLAPGVVVDSQTLGEEFGRRLKAASDLR